MLKRKRSKWLRVLPLVCLLASMVLLYLVWEVQKEEKFRKKIAQIEQGTPAKIPSPATIAVNTKKSVERKVQPQQIEIKKKIIPTPIVAKKRIQKPVEVTDRGNTKTKVSKRKIRTKKPSQNLSFEKGIKIEISQAINLGQEIEVTAAITGGHGPYKIKWDNGQVGDRASYPTPGYHYLIVEDSKGDGLLQDFNIKPIDQLKLVSQPTLKETSTQQILKEEASKLTSRPLVKTEIAEADTQKQLKFDAPSFQMSRASLLKGDLRDFVSGSKNKELKFEVIRPCKEGELKFGYNGTFYYRPNIDFQGRDAFSVSICDDDLCLLGRVEIEVGSATISDNSN